MIEPEKPLNELADAEIENLVGRALKFSSCIHLFDYMMAKQRSSAKSNFLPGIQSLINIWDKAYVFGDTVPRILFLYPAAGRPLPSGTKDCDEVVEILDDCIVTQLQCGSIKIERHPKQDPNSFCHARGFIAKRRAYTIDPGIDALKVFPPTRPMLFARSKAAEVYFSQYQALEGLAKK